MVWFRGYLDHQRDLVQDVDLMVHVEEVMYLKVNHTEYTQEEDRRNLSESNKDYTKGLLLCRSK